MQFVQGVSSEPYLEFSRIRKGIYNAPYDFFIKAGSLYEPIDDMLLRECGGSSTSFPLAHVYEALQKSNDCDHIWRLLGPLFSVSRDTDIKTLCETMPGVYQVPKDVVVVRMRRSPAIGGSSYRLISRKWHSECSRLFTLSRRTTELMLAEIYGGLWIRHHDGEDQSCILLEMEAMMQGWLQDTAFSNTEEGMLTKLVLKLGTYIHSQVIANLEGVSVISGMYKLTQVLPHGMVRGKIHWTAELHLQGRPDVWYMPTATVENLVNAFR